MYPSCLPFANFKNRLPSSWPASALQAHDAEEYKRLEAAGAQVIQKRCPDPLRLGLFDVCSMMVEKIRYIHHVQTHPHHSAHAICSSADVNLVDSAVVHCPAAVQDAKGMTTGKLLAASSSLSRVSQWMAAMLLLGERASVESATQPGLECLGLPCHDPWVTDASRSDQGNDMGDYSQSQGVKSNLFAGLKAWCERLWSCSQVWCDRRAWHLQYYRCGWARLSVESNLDCREDS
jgi:hypothetical protein